MRLYTPCLCLHQIWSKSVDKTQSTATVAKKPPKWTLLRHNVATSLRHDYILYMVRCVLYHVPVLTKFEANLSKRHGYGGQKWTFSRRYDVTSGYIIIFPDLVNKQITVVGRSAIYSSYACNYLSYSETIFIRSLTNNGSFTPKYKFKNIRD